MSESKEEFNMTRQQKRLYKKRTGIDLDKMNKAGFYEGMPGVFLDADGNQRIYEVFLTPNNELLVRYGVHPAGVNKAFKHLIQENELTRAAFMIAVDTYRRNTKRYQRKQRWKKRFNKFLSFFNLHKVPKDQTVNDNQVKPDVPSKMHVVKEESKNN